MTKLAELIGAEEGIDIPGSVPQRNNNPGDLRHSPHSFHTAQAPNAVGRIRNIKDGWADLERQLNLFAARKFTLAECIYTYAPPSENDSAAYLAYIVKGLGCRASTTVAEALKIKGEHANE